MILEEILLAHSTPCQLALRWRAGGFWDSGLGRDLCLLYPQASPVRADCGASAGRWVCLGWASALLRVPGFLHGLPHTPSPSFCSVSLLALKASGEAFLGNPGFSVPLGVPSRIPLGMEHFVMPVKPFSPWSRQCSGSDVYWDRKGYALSKTIRRRSSGSPASPFPAFLSTGSYYHLEESV